MNTTNVFVELLVIGLGPVAAATLVVAVAFDPAALGPAALVDAGTSLLILVPLLAITYILGILVDRLADRTFSGWADRIRHRYFDSDDEYHTARRTIVYHSEPMYRIRQYGRSRMRICRGWAVNAALLVVPANLYVAGALETGAVRGVLLSNVGLGLLLLGTTLSWRVLAHSEYRKIRGGAEFIRTERAREGDGATT